MTYYQHYHDTRDFNLVIRNEGKLKSFDSCTDVRAWSHRTECSNEYLKDWMKKDMKISAVPPWLLNRISKKINFDILPGRCCRRDCKSKILLDSIRKSCAVLKSHLQNDKKFEKYFEEEELETSHWPCDQSLEALKSIKIFCKVIVEKVFGITLSHGIQNGKNSTSRGSKLFSPRANIIQEIANYWNKEIVALAEKIRAKSINSASPIPKYNNKECDCYKMQKNKVSTHIMDNGIQRLECNNREEIDDYITCNLIKPSSSCMLSQKKVRLGEKSIETEVKIKLCRSTKFERTKDVGCDPCKDLQNLFLKTLQRDYEELKQEIVKLKQENSRLKEDLNNKVEWGKVVNCSSSFCPTRIQLSPPPEPFEKSLSQSHRSSPETVDSEMTITLERCTNKKYRHISRLKLEHKTNAARNMETISKDLYCKKVSAINLLTKVKEALGRMVEREIKTTKDDENNSQIRASYHKLFPVLSH